MRLYGPRINCRDKLMALLLFYSVIKFLLITLTQRSSKGQAVSRGKLQSCQKESEMGIHDQHKKVFIIDSKRK